MTGILLTRTALAAGVDTLRTEIAEADDTISPAIARAGLAMLHTLLSRADDVTVTQEAEAAAAAEEDAEVEAEADAAPEDHASAEPPAARATVWTAARVAWLREHYATSSDNDAMLAALNALPGPPIRSLVAVYKQTSILRLARTSAAPSPPKVSRVWTKQRDAMLLARFFTTDDPLALLREINALPGDSVGSVAAMKTRAYTQRKLAERGATAEAEAPPEPRIFPPPEFRPPAVVAPPPATPAEDEEAEEEAEAAAAIRLDPGRWNGRALAEHYGWRLEKAAAFVQRVRAETAAAPLAPAAPGGGDACAAPAT